MPLKSALRTARDLVYRGLYRGTGRLCPVCEKMFRRFAPFGVDGRRSDAMCPHCGSLERHRLLWLFFERKTDLFDGRPKSMLHIAPERCLVPRLRKRLGIGYITADLHDPAADVQLDVTDIHYPPDNFDVIYCSHVLEHVPDDRKALKQMQRVLKPDGWAVIMVPITTNTTYEDPTVTDPRERRRLFGQNDHVRRYGRDFVSRLLDAGFDVRVFGALDVGDETELELMGLSGGGEIFWCSKARPTRLRRE
jgi:SAM-dependent methyltransferase